MSLEYDVHCCSVSALVSVLAAQVGVQPQLYVDNLKCLSRNPDLLLSAARFTTCYVRMVGQEPAPRKCVLLSTSGEVRKDLKDRVLSQDGDRWSVKFDVRDLGGRLDTTFRVWSSTLAARVRLVISRLAPVFVLPLDFHGGVRVVRSMYLPASLHGIEALLRVYEGFGLLFVGWCGLVTSLWLVLELFLACWMGPVGVTPLFAWSGLGFACFGAILPFGLLRSVEFIVCLRWFMRVVLGMVLFIFFLLALLRWLSVGSSCPGLGSAWSALA